MRIPKTNPEEVMTLRESAVSRWPEVIRQFGESPKDWKLEEISHREEAKTARIVVRATHITGKRLTFKHELRPWNSDKFALQYARHIAAFETFPATEKFAISKPLFLDETQQCALYEYTKGKSLKDHLTNACKDRSDQLRIVESAGRWLDIFHRSRFKESRSFSVNWTLNRFREIRDEVEKRRIDIPNRALFLDGIEKVEEISAGLNSLKTMASAQHGDFHIGNLIWDGTLMTGIDISSEHVAPVGFDICKFLVDFTRRFWKATEVGQVIPREVSDAVLSGYTLVGPDDPGVRLVSFTQIL